VRILHLKARAAYNANKHTNDILPRWVCEELGERGPAHRHRRVADHAKEAVMAAAEGVVKATR